MSDHEDEPLDDEEDEQEPGTDVVRRLPLDPGREPWEKQPGESLKAFTAFALYRDLGDARSTAKVAQELGKSLALIQRWSRRNQWAVRRDAYDLYRDRRAREATETAVDAARRRQAALGARLQGGALQRLQGDPGAGIERLDWNEATLGDVTRAAEVGQRIEAIALGMATSIVKGVRDVPGHEVVIVVRKIVEAALVEFEKGVEACLECGHAVPTPSADAFLMRVDEIGRTG